MRRAPLLLLVPTALTLATAACGDGDDEQVAVGASSAAIAAAGEATLATDTVRTEMTTTIDMSGFLPGAPESAEIRATGISDFANDRSEVEIDFAQLFGQLGGDDTDSQAAAMLEAFAEPVRQIQDGTTLYQCGSLYRMLSGAECLRIDLAEVAGVDAGQLTGVNPTDPSAMLDSLRGTGEVEEVGTEEIDGVTTQHLRGSFTLAAAIEQLPADAAAEFESAYEAMGLDRSTLDEEHRFDIWIDGDGLVRKLRQELSMGGENGFSSVSEVRFFDYGVEADIEVPTDAVDFDEVLGSLGSLTG